MLPNWITEIDGKANVFVVDPDVYIPEWQAALGLDALDQYWLEVILGCMKLDFDVFTRMSGKVVAGLPIERRVRADDGRKQRWNRTMHPVGSVPKIEGIPVGGKRWDDLPINLRAAHIRHHYRRVRGMIPTG